ncbi:MAG: hypothetical protein QOI54_2712 [Actinomycetota bacterium]|nr:hypothetical protein [Actinomycetota bacterium]
MVTRTKGLAAATAGALAVAALAGASAAGASDRPLLRGLAHANPKAPGLSSPNRLSVELAQVTRAQGSDTVENPQDGVGYYGYDSIDNVPPLLPVVGAGGASLAEAHKTEPDKNTYLVLRGQDGPDPAYDYGTHFLFQGHEGGTPGYVSRVNLDADPAHRITILATRDAKGLLPDFDGSTWNPFANKLLMTSENGAAGGVWAGDVNYSPGATFTELPALGKAGYEGIQTASDGSIWMVEDVGGATVAGTNGRLANSFVYRFVPTHKGDLTTGTLQALQVLRRSGDPMDTAADLMSQDIEDLHKLGSSFATRWVTVHQTTSANATQTFSSLDAAKAAKATAFKRPENGVFRPGSHFGEFFFTETGDTNATSTANGQAGGWGGVFRLRQNGPSAGAGTLSLVSLGDAEHTSFDNLAFADEDHLLVVEDRGDLLHAQLNALDSGWVISVGRAGSPPVRFLAEGRDASATIDSALTDAKVPGFQNDGDNEITGIHVSDGDPSDGGLLGAKQPRLFEKGWRLFWTAQHGDNVTSEIVPQRTAGSRSRHGLRDQRDE